MPFFFVPSPEAEEGGDAGAAVPGRRPWGATAAMEEGKRGREPREIDSLPRLGRRRPVEVAPRRAAAGGIGERGDGTVAPGRGLAAAYELEDAEGVLPLPSPRAEAA